jgi:hypothetical protein
MTQGTAPAPEQAQILGDDEITYCQVHPTVQTALRCNRCGRYMCTKCAVHTAVGYRCKQCLRQVQEGFFNATTTDYLIGTAVAVVGGGISGFVVREMGLWILILLFVGLATGSFVGEAVHRAVGRRRGEYLWLFVAAGIAIGAMLPLLPLFIDLIGDYNRLSPAALRRFERQSGGLFSVLFQLALPTLIHIVLSAGTAAARLRYGGK